MCRKVSLTKTICVFSFFSFDLHICHVCFCAMQVPQAKGVTVDRKMSTYFIRRHTPIYNEVEKVAAEKNRLKCPKLQQRNVFN